MKNKLIITAGLLAANFVTYTCHAQAQSSQTLYLAAYGGSIEKLFKANILPDFESKNNVKVVYVAGNSTDTMAKLQAQKGKQELDVVIMDDGPMYQAAQLGFCDKLASSPIYDQVYDFAKMGDSAVTIGVAATGLAYNTEAFKKAGWPKPESWEVLTDKKFKEKVAIPPISNSYGLQTLIMFSKLRKGSEKAIDPGFTAMAKEVAPNVLAWEPSAGKMTELFQNGEVVLAVWGNGRVNQLKNTGFPIEFVYPKEGAMALGLAACPVAGSKMPEKAQALVQYLLSPQVQYLLANDQALGPANKSVKLPPPVAAKVPYGPEQVGKLVQTNWTVVNEKRAEWTNRWNRTLER